MHPGARYTPGGQVLIVSYTPGGQVIIVSYTVEGWVITVLIHLGPGSYSLILIHLGAR